MATGSSRSRPAADAGRAGSAACQSRRSRSARRAASRPTAAACAVSSSRPPSPARPPVGQHAGRQRAGEEPGRPGVVAGLVPGHVEQRGRRGPAHRGHDQVALRRGAVGQLDGLHAAVAADPDQVAAGPGVDHPGDLHSGLAQVGHGGVAVGVGGQHHRPLPRPDRVQPDQPPDRGREHDAGHVVALEHVRPLDQARRDDQHLGPGLDQLLGDRAGAARAAPRRSSCRRSARPPPSWSAPRCPAWPRPHRAARPARPARQRRPSAGGRRAGAPPRPASPAPRPCAAATAAARPAGRRRPPARRDGRSACPPPPGACPARRARRARTAAARARRPATAAAAG